MRRAIVAMFLLTAACRWAQEAQQVTYEQTSPRELLRKYEWFKDSAAQLDKKRADIEVMRIQVESLEDAYADVGRADWARSDRESHAIMTSELTGLTMSYNRLAADYNSQMAKANWSFANVGALPVGLPDDAVPLPREFAQYEIK